VRSGGCPEVSPIRDQGVPLRPEKSVRSDSEIELLSVSAANTIRSSTPRQQLPQLSTAVRCPTGFNRRPARISKTALESCPHPVSTAAARHLTHDSPRGKCLRAIFLPKDFHPRAAHPIRVQRAVWFHSCLPERLGIGMFSSPITFFRSSHTSARVCAV